MAKQIDIKEEWISPQKATRWLAAMVEHHTNRAVDNDWVLALALDMAEGRWVARQSTIKLACDKASGAEYPIDGQHRLRAIILHGTAVRSRIERNVPASDYVRENQSKPHSSGARGKSRWNVPESVAKVIVTASLPMLGLEQFNGKALTLKRLTKEALVEKIDALCPEVVQLAQTYGSQLNGVHGTTKVQKATVLRWLYNNRMGDAALLDGILRTLRNVGEPGEQVPLFAFARERLRWEAERASGTGANNKGARELPVLRQMAVLDFTLRSLAQRARIKTQIGFDQECTGYLCGEGFGIESEYRKQERNRAA